MSNVIDVIGMHKKNPGDDAARASRFSTLFSVAAISGKSPRIGLWERRISGRGGRVKGNAGAKASVGNTVGAHRHMLSRF